MSYTIQTTGACKICARSDAGIVRSQLEADPPFTATCPRCGTYKYGSNWLDLPSDEARVRLAGWVRYHNDSGIEPAITPEKALNVFSRPRPSYTERARCALALMAQKVPSLEKYSNSVLTDPEMIGRTYSSSRSDVFTLLMILADDGFVDINMNLKEFRLTPKGLVASEKLSRTPASAQAFVAMSFDPVLDDAWTQGFYEAIRSAGYKPVRIDKKDRADTVTDEIMDEIRRSKFVVADYTGQQNGVYFDVGFALGLGLTVIPTCHADEAENLTLDIRHINTLSWKTPEDLAAGLGRRIRAVIGGGPDLPRPATT